MGGSGRGGGKEGLVLWLVVGVVVFAYVYLRQWDSGFEHRQYMSADVRRGAGGGGGDQHTNTPAAGRLPP